MTHNDPEWLTMTQDDIPGVLGAPGGPGGHQGVQGGARGHQGAPGGSRLPLAPKRVVKQQNNGPKPWFKVPKVCPDPKGMVFTHFWDIWGHLGALKQSYLVKLQYHQKRLFKKKIVWQLRRPPGANFDWFHNFPITMGMSWSLENWEISQKLHLVVCVIVRKLA